MMRHSANQRLHEAITISDYLLKTTPEAYMIDLYTGAVEATQYQPDEQRLVDIAFAHPWLLKPLDSGLALLSPNHELRRRIFIMFSLLEASPDYTNKFLPVQRNPLYLLLVGLRGVSSVLNALCGVAIIKFGGLA